MAKNNSNLVRPRTIAQDSPSSLASLHNHHDAARKRQRHSCQELFLCGACMFLFILCACLIAILVLVSHSLQSGALLSHCKQTNTSLASPAVSTNESDRSFWYKLLDFATTKLFSNKHLIRFGGGNIGADSENISMQRDSSSTGFDRAQNNSMVYQSKVIRHLTWRLPREIKPKFYDLFLHPDFDTQRFSGNVSIRLEVTRPISFVAVHMKNLNITETNLVRNLVGDDSTQDISIVRAFAYPEFDYWIIELDEPLDVGEHTLRLIFNGNLKGKITGFYSSAYKDIANNQTR